MKFRPTDVVFDDGQPIGVMADLILGAALAFVAMAENPREMERLFSQHQETLISVLRGIEKLEHSSQ